MYIGFFFKTIYITQHKKTRCYGNLFWKPNKFKVQTVIPEVLIPRSLLTDGLNPIFRCEIHSSTQFIQNCKIKRTYKSH